MGTLLAFAIVCAGVWILRRRNPDLHRPFKTPLVPLVPILGILSAGYLIWTLASADQGGCGDLAGRRVHHLLHVQREAQQGAACAAGDDGCGGLAVDLNQDKQRGPAKAGPLSVSAPVRRRCGSFLRRGSGRIGRRRRRSVVLRAAVFVRSSLGSGWGGVRRLGGIGLGRVGFVGLGVGRGR